MNKNNTSKRLLAALLLTIGFVGAPIAQAALEDRGHGLIFDTDLNVTWLADANYSSTSHYNTNGVMGWNAANTWVDNLTVGGYSDWRLPTISEMGHLFYNELDGVAGQDIATTHNNANYSLFQNLDSYYNHYYWSGTESASDTSKVPVFRFADGREHLEDKTSGNFAMAIRPGDIVSAVPEPETYAMLMAGLGLLGFIARRRKTT